MFILSACAALILSVFKIFEYSIFEILKNTGHDILKLFDNIVVTSSLKNTGMELTAQNLERGGPQGVGHVVSALLGL